MKKEMKVPRLKEKRPVKKLFVAATGAIGGLLCTATTVMAEPTTTLFQKAQAAIKLVYDEIFAISTAAWAISMLVCLLTYMFVRNEKAMGTAKRSAIVISIAFLGINCLGWILELLTGLTTDGSYTF